MVVVPGSEGDFGVLHGHAPLISTVRPGVLEVFQGNKVEQRFLVVGGFAEVTPERCTVLADEAVPFERGDAPSSSPSASGRPSASSPTPPPTPRRPRPRRTWRSPRTCGGPRPTTPAAESRFRTKFSFQMCAVRPLKAGAERPLYYGLPATSRRGFSIMGNWTLETIAWDRFDASKVDPEILRNIKAAALVERNGGDYGIYLGRVFADDAGFHADR